jgi:hypothetical protein
MGGRVSGRGVRWCGGEEGSDQRCVVVVGTVVGVVASVVAVDKSAEGAANNLGDRGRSYGGPQREGRVIVQGG